MPQENKYVIIREDLVQDPVTIITDGLLIGRLQECELLAQSSRSLARASRNQADRATTIFCLACVRPIR